jgi:competence protein ComEC
LERRPRGASGGAALGLAAAPLLPLALAFAGGLALAERGTAPAWAAFASAAALLGAAAAALLAKWPWVAQAAFLAAAVALGVLRGQPPPLPADHLARLVLPGTATIEGRLLDEPIRFAPDGIRLHLEAQALIGVERRRLTGRLQATIYGEAPPLGAGQRVAAELRLRRPAGFRNPGAFDYPGHLRRAGILVLGSGRGDRIEPLTGDDPPWPVRVKRWAVDSVHARLPAASAALLAGLLLGERAALSREADLAFRRAGVYHILAVSGFNVALLASSTFAALALLRLPRRLTALAAGGVLVAFALVVGAQPSVLRATAMGLLVLAAVLLERDSRLVNSVAAAALALLLWHPGDLWAPGFQLSFVATLGIIGLAPPATRVLSARGWPPWIAAAVAVSLGAQLAVTPIMLLHFNQLSLIGVAANLVVVPLAGAATTLGALALLATLASDLVAAPLFHVLWAVLLGLRAAVAAAAAVPAAMVHLPAPSGLAVAAWFAALTLWAAGRGAGRRAVATALLVLAAGLGAWPWLRPGDGRLRISFLDVGQGDATLIELPEGQRILVDGGPGGPRRFDVGERVLAPFLWNRGIRRLDLVALSHSDPDHAGGLAAILRHFTVGEFWPSARWGAGSEDTRRAVERSRVRARVPARGQRAWIGSALLTVLHPDDGAGDGSERDENDRSQVLRLDWGAVSLLLTGDLGQRGEAELVRRQEPLRTLVLKVGHHGSRFSTSPAFLDAVRPAVAVISVGGRNPFGHPAPETLARLEAAGARVYRTDRDGAVLLESDGLTLWITRWGRGTTERVTLDPGRPPDAPKAPGAAGGLRGTRGEREGERRDYSSKPRSTCRRSRSSSSGSRRMPRESPISPRIALISLSDFLPKFLVFSSSDSVFWTRSAMVRMLAVFRQLDARTESSSSSTFRNRCSFSCNRGVGSGPPSLASGPAGSPRGNSTRRLNWSSRMREASATAASGVTLPLVHTSISRRSVPASAPGSTPTFTRCTGEKSESMRIALMGSASSSRFSADW